ncbi:MAG: hypothetical protein KGN16_05890 [Burkholderiales bacterium]|nr:hypothetical protein [Burkholderiales bacterium]
MNTAWRQANFAAANRPFLDDAQITFNGYRRSGAAAKADETESEFSGRYVVAYAPRFDILTRALAVTTWDYDFARIALDHTRGPMQVAYITIVWKRTSDGWHFLAHHESTRPKALDAPFQALAPYTGPVSRRGRARPPFHHRGRESQCPSWRSAAGGPGGFHRSRFRHGRYPDDVRQQP